MALSNTFSLLASVTLFLMLANKVNSQVDQSLVCFTFHNFTNNPNLIYKGDAHAVDEGVLRLIKTDDSGLPQPYSVGRVLSSAEIPVVDPSRLSSFITIIEFKITHVDENPGGRIAFFVGRPDIFIPNYPLVAVEFDVYHNTIGIDVWGKSVNTTEWESVSGQPVTALIVYDANFKRLSVYATVQNKTYTVTYDILDFTTPLPEYVRFGISGATGQQVAILDLHFWGFCSFPALIAKKEKEHMYMAQYV